MRRLISLLMVLALAGGSLALMGCSGGDEEAEEITETEAEAQTTGDAVSEESDDPLVGTWENTEADAQFPRVVIRADGTAELENYAGTVSEGAWSLEDAHLRFESDIGETRGGGIEWVTDDEFEMAYAGTYLRVGE